MNQEIPEGASRNEELPKASASADFSQNLESAEKIDLPQSSQPRPRAVDHPLTKVFIGADGLRPIWRLLIYLAMVRILYVLLSAALNFVEDSDARFLWIAMASEFMLLVAAIVPAFVRARLEKRSVDEYGLPVRDAFSKLFWNGVLWGIAALSVLILALHGGHAFTLGKLALHGLRIIKFAAFWGVFFLIVAFAEEFLLRGYSLFTLSQAIGFWPAAVLLSMAFGAIHQLNPGEAWNGLVAASCIGLFFCLTLRRTGSLWFAVGFHAAWDWGESYLYSVPDSGGISPGHLFKSSLHGPNWLTGGSVGPEGSALIFVLLILLWVVFDRAYPEVNYNPAPPIKILASEGFVE
jgi:membrane protease YdiL (CAAX protease family)